MLLIVEDEQPILLHPLPGWARWALDAQIQLSLGVLGLVQVALLIWEDDP